MVLNLSDYRKGQSRQVREDTETSLRGTEPNRDLKIKDDIDFYSELAGDKTPHYTELSVPSTVLNSS